MSHWSPEKIKNLRQRLGWSAADFSRHFGVSSLIVLDWESGVSRPTSDDILHIERLEFHLESSTAQLQTGPQAEVALKNLKLNQIGLDQIKKFYT